MKNIYALLVGIDNYPPPTPKLGGAKSDVNKIKNYLEANFKEQPVHLKILLDQDATYANFVENFRNHLGQAGEHDVVWFHYSGHGSRQFSAPEFAEVNSGGRDETLVLYDSRPSGNDFADKEMAVLLSELSAKNPHIIVTLDCCHSGSGTRSADEFVKRLSVDREDKRTIDSYLNGFYKSRSVHDIPKSKYILFAACNRFQSAKESFTGGGLFTENLIQTLDKSNKDISYARLMVKLRQGVVKMKWDQDPQLELVGDINSYTRFLDGSVTNEAPRFAVSFTEEGWTLEAGQILGINEEVNLAIYPDQSNEILTKAKVLKSSAHRSILAEVDQLNKESKYWAVPLNLPAIPFEVGLKVSDQFLDFFLKQAQNFLNVKLNHPAESDDPFVLNQSKNFIEFTNATTNEILFKTNTSLDPSKIEQSNMDLLKKIDQIGIWTRFFTLQNNKTMLSLESCTITVEIMKEDQLIQYPPGEIKLKSGDARVPYKLWIQNKFTQPLHFSLIYLSDHYGATPLKNDPLEKSDSPTLFWGGKPDDVFMILPGQPSSSDSFLIIISTEHTDEFNFTLEEMEFGEIKVDQRAIPGLNRTTKIKGEWYTNRFVVNLER